MGEFLELKENGNQLFKEGNYEEALVFYTKSLSLLKEENNDKVNVLKNLSACNLKLEKYDAAVRNATKALEISPNDPKALFRRCQAYEKLERIEEAHQDAMKLFSIEPKNTAIQPILRQLNIVIQNKAKENTTTESKVNRMFNLVFDENSNDKEKRLQAANNLIVLAREDSGANIIFKNNGLDRLSKMLEEKDPEINLVALRVLSCLCSQNRQRATTVLNGMTLFKICVTIASPNEHISTSATHLLRNIVIAIADLEEYKKDRDRHETLRRKDPGLKLRPFPPLQLDDEAQGMIDKILRSVILMLNQAKVSAVGRDNVMELLLKLITRTEGLGWTRTLLDSTDALAKLLEVAGTIKEHKTIPITENSRQHASLVLSRIYDDTMSDKEREIFLNQCTEFLVDLFGDDIMESKLEAITAVCALLQGPFEVGNSVLSREGVIQVILAMAQDGIQLHQKIAVEALVLSASKKDKCTGIIKQAVPILKDLYQTADDYIKVRALVGLCKLGSVGGTDTSAKTFADGSNTTLAKSCRKFLCNPAKDVDLRKWAAEGLAFLTLDADVKEDLVNDEVALRSLTDLAKHSDKSILYPVATVFVNVTNSYDKPDIEPEMKELAKFSKQHIPEEHEMDKPDYVDERKKKKVPTATLR